MKRIFIYTVIGVGILLSAASCNKFLDVKPIDRLTGNNFYKTSDDVEASIGDFSRKLYEKITETQFMGATGEYRSGEVLSDPLVRGNSTRTPQNIFFIDKLGKNKIIDVLNNPDNLWGHYNFGSITDWRRFYEVIQGSSILIEKLDAGVPGVTEAMKAQYIGEATFIRCFAYFIMVRLYGDVPYYTDAFHIEPLPRESMVSIMNKCIADLESRKNGMIWTFSEPAFRGVRATRSSAIALLMNMNMWNAGFDLPNSNKYNQATVLLGKELVDNESQHNNRLLPIEQWSTVVGGRSDESLFEFYQSVNYGVSTNIYAPISQMFLHYPYKSPFYDWEKSSAYYRASYMEKIYPQGVADSRKNIWLIEPYADNGLFNFAKLSGVNVNAGGVGSANPDNSYIFFRYADALLMYAEALANEGNDIDALKMLNRVRLRAHAPAFEGVGAELKDFIFLERSRELIGEGVHYFDLVRTRRLLSITWTSNPLSADQFARGGWTWPISNNAIRNNPYITLTDYWVNGGI